MDNAKEQERDALHKAIWAIADDLRGSVAKEEGLRAAIDKIVAKIEGM